MIQLFEIKTRTLCFAFCQPPKKSLPKSLTQKKSLQNFKPKKSPQIAKFKPKKGLRTSPSLIYLSCVPPPPPWAVRCGSVVSFVWIFQFALILVSYWNQKKIIIIKRRFSLCFLTCFTESHNRNVVMSNDDSCGDKTDAQQHTNKNKQSSQPKPDHKKKKLRQYYKCQ